MQSEPAIRRMLFIRQLGLKAYVDYPGAIHTRYSHALGVMHLAGRVAKSLMEEKTTAKAIAKNLESNLDNVMAAGFLHDIAHGPFSHAVDYALYKMTGKSHEGLVEEILKGKISETLQKWGINPPSVVQIINGTHAFPFIREIVNGPIDTDKLDYLQRDAYHIGLRYSFDLEEFISQFRVIGRETEMEGCRLGLADSGRAVVTADLFLMIWKSMYDLVYHVQDSRIAEKMLEKAVLMNIDNQKIKDSFDPTKGYLTLQDEHLVEVLGEIPAAKDTIDAIRRGEVYKLVYEQVFDQKTLNLDTSFTAKFTGNENDRSELSDALSKKLCEELHVDEYNYIVDFVRSRKPGEVRIDKFDEQAKDWVRLESRSKIFQALSPETRLKVYGNPKLVPLATDSLSGALKKLVEDTKF